VCILCVCGRICAPVSACVYICVGVRLGQHMYVCNSSMHCNTLQLTTTHCNSLHLPAMHYNTLKHNAPVAVHEITDMGWLRLVGSFKVKISFAKEPN